MSRRPVDRVSLAAGITTIVLGAVLLLDQAESLDVSGNVFAALVAAALGTILLISGLNDD